MDRTFALLAAVLGFLGVALGAFGAHALRDRLTQDMHAVYQTAVQYHQIHALALFAAAWAAERFGGTASTVAGFCFLGGVLVFSGSLYVLALSGVRALGAITPLGGLALLAGWAALAVAALGKS